MSTDLALAQVRLWGSTLRPVTIGRAHVVFQAPDGHLWDSVRDAFWGQHLNMCLCEDHEDQLELMRVTLKCVAEDMHRIDPEAMVDALFGGSELFLRHFLLDLTRWIFELMVIPLTAQATVPRYQQGRSATIDHYARPTLRDDCSCRPANVQRTRDY